ncbi:MAG: hypothetical protein ACRD3B_06380 [Candidatus Sulfotelmatobacter sp.]
MPLQLSSFVRLDSPFGALRLPRAGWKAAAVPTRYFPGGDVNFLNQLLRGISFVPALVSGIESVFASKSGAEKKDAAMTFLENALSMADAVSAREIISPDQFKNGISQIIDGVVLCMNASAWAKKGEPAPNASAPGDQ